MQLCKALTFNEYVPCKLRPLLSIYFCVCIYVCNSDLLLCFPDARGATSENTSKHVCAITVDMDISYLFGGHAAHRMWHQDKLCSNVQTWSTVGVYTELL